MALGYSTDAAFRQSIARNTTPIPVFRIENRKGKFALTKDLAEWLMAKRSSVMASDKNNFGKEERNMSD